MCRALGQRHGSSISLQSLNPTQKAFSHFLQFFSIGFSYSERYFSLVANNLTLGSFTAVVIAVAVVDLSSPLLVPPCSSNGFFNIGLLIFARFRRAGETYFYNISWNYRLSTFIAPSTHTTLTPPFLSDLLTLLQMYQRRESPVLSDIPRLRHLPLYNC